MACYSNQYKIIPATLSINWSPRQDAYRLSCLFREPEGSITSFVARSRFKNAAKAQQIVENDAGQRHILLPFANLAFDFQKQIKNRQRRQFPLDEMRRVASRSYLNHGSNLPPETLLLPRIFVQTDPFLRPRGHKMNCSYD